MKPGAFDIDFSLFGFTPDEKSQDHEDGDAGDELGGAIVEDESDNPVDANKVRAASAIKTIPYHKMIRMISDKNIEQLLPWHFEKGVAYHCLSYGGIDSWSYLKFILRQQRLKYCLISSWIISSYDADEILERVKAGDIERVDFYVGDIFKGGYRGAYDKTLQIAEMCGGRVTIFHNHSKVICGFGENFDFCIETSTNLNVNLRLEQTTIFTDRELALFYKNYFDEIHAFNRDFDNWKPWEGWRDDGKGTMCEREPEYKGTG